MHKTFSPPLPCQITLLQAVPKAKAMDYIVQKATELGAARVVPILSERTVVHLDGEDAGGQGGEVATDRHRIHQAMRLAVADED